MANDSMHPERTVVTACAPTRLDLVGGWTDVQPFCDDEPGLVINLAYGLYVRVRLYPRRGVSLPENPLAAAALTRMGLHDTAVELESDAPVGAGLGGSGAAGVALVGAMCALKGTPLMPVEIAELAHSIELDDMGIFGGKQDQYAAALGGALALTFEGNMVKVERLELSPSLLEQLAARSVVVYTGHSRLSGDVHAHVQGAYQRRAPETLAALKTIRRVAKELRAELERGSLDDMGELLNENWAAQKQLHPSTTNAQIDSLFETARDAGALGGKALGAGGGGCVYFLAREGAARELQAVLERHGVRSLPVHIGVPGLSVTFDPA